MHDEYIHQLTEFRQSVILFILILDIRLAEGCTVELGLTTISATHYDGTLSYWE